jgi:hypothetical protein
MSLYVTQLDQPKSTLRLRAAAAMLPDLAGIRRMQVFFYNSYATLFQKLIEEHEGGSKTQQWLLSLPNVPARCIFPLPTPASWAHADVAHYAVIIGDKTIMRIDNQALRFDAPVHVGLVRDGRVVHEWRLSAEDNRGSKVECVDVPLDDTEKSVMKDLWKAHRPAKLPVVRRIIPQEEEVEATAAQQRLSPPPPPSQTVAQTDAAKTSSTPPSPPSEELATGTDGVARAFAAEQTIITKDIEQQANETESAPATMEVELPGRQPKEHPKTTTPNEELQGKGRLSKASTTTPMEVETPEPETQQPSVETVFPQTTTPPEMNSPENHTAEESVETTEEVERSNVPATAPTLRETEKEQLPSRRTSPSLPPARADIEEPTTKPSNEGRFDRHNGSDVENDTVEESPPAVADGKVATPLSPVNDSRVQAFRIIQDERKDGPPSPQKTKEALHYHRLVRRMTKDYNAQNHLFFSASTHSLDVCHTASSRTNCGVILRILKLFQQRIGEDSLFAWSILLRWF